MNPGEPRLEGQRHSAVGVGSGRARALRASALGCQSSRSTRRAVVTRLDRRSRRDLASALRTNCGRTGRIRRCHLTLDGFPLL